MEEILHQIVDPSSYYGKVQELCHQQEPLFKLHWYLLYNRKSQSTGATTQVVGQTLGQIGKKSLAKIPTWPIYPS